MLDVPQRPPAPDLRDDSKVVDGRWRRDGPFQRPGVPGIIPSQLSFEIRLHKVEHETQHPRNLENHADRADHVPGFPTEAWLVGINPSWHPQKSRNVHEIKSEMEADQKQPEMPLAQSLVQHPSRHLGIPVIEGSEEREENSTHDYIVEVSHDEVRKTELPVKGRRGEHDSSQTGDEELEQKRDREHHGRGIADFAPPHRAEPVEYLDPGRD